MSKRLTKEREPTDTSRIFDTNGFENDCGIISRYTSWVTVISASGVIQSESELTPEYKGSRDRQGQYQHPPTVTGRLE